MVTVEAAEIRKRADHVFEPLLLPGVASSLACSRASLQTPAVEPSPTRDFFIPPPPGRRVGMRSRIVIAGASAEAMTQGATADPSETAALPTLSEG